MDAKTFFITVATLRKLRKEYFTTRDPETFKRCRELEKQLDDEISRVVEIKGLVL